MYILQSHGILYVVTKYSNIRQIVPLDIRIVKLLFVFSLIYEPMIALGEVSRRSACSASPLSVCEMGGRGSFLDMARSASVEEGLEAIGGCRSSGGDSRPVLKN